MRSNIVFKIFIFFMSSTIFGHTTKDYFTIDGVIRGYYKGYLYLRYNDKKDSCFVKNNRFHFEGKTSAEVVFSTHFSTKRTSAMDKNFFIENENIKIDITIENKKINNTNLDWIIINSISGTKTNLIEKDYEAFKIKHEKDKDWQSKHYRKIDEIVSKHPKNQYSGELLSTIASDSLADIHGLQSIYKKLDLGSQSQVTIIYIKRKIYPIESLKIGKPMMDFELPNEKENSINTKRYRGSILLIDFWASWCAPCRKQIPKITEVYEKFKNRNFKILSVSIDNDKSKWLIALEKEKIQWDNVLEDKEFSSEIVKEYEIISIPSTFLIDENGIIIANNPTMQELENYLNKNLK